MSKTPYYSHAGITIYHGDNREVLAHLGMFDLLLTDPPYGIGESSKKNATRAKLASARDYGAYSWDSEPAPMETINAAIGLCDLSIIWGGNYFSLPPCKGPLVWDKENSGDFADGELAWNNLGTALRIKRHMWNGMLRKGREERFHPTQKPIDVMLWCLSFAPDARTVLDPWLGSGTTLVAAKMIGLQATGIELEERYCEIAATRLQQEMLRLDADPEMCNV